MVTGCGCCGWFSTITGAVGGSLAAEAPNGGNASAGAAGSGGFLKSGAAAACFLATFALSVASVLSLFTIAAQPNSIIRKIPPPKINIAAPFCTLLDFF